MFNLGIIFSTFLIVFFAELGDKTQLVAFSMTSTSRHSLLIFIATSLALTLSSVAAAIIGGITANLIPSFTGYISAALFLGFGFYILFSKEPPKIKECFFKSLTLENTLIHILPKFLKKIGRYNYQAVDILRQEKSHGEVFKVLLKEKKLFKDDINASSQLDCYMKELDLKRNLMRLSPQEALAEIIAKEEAGMMVFSFILEHIDREQHHNEASLEALLRTLIDEETGHLRFYKNMLEELKKNG